MAQATVNSFLCRLHWQTILSHSHAASDRGEEEAASHECEDELPPCRAALREVFHDVLRTSGEGAHDVLRSHLRSLRVETTVITTESQAN